METESQEQKPKKPLNYHIGNAMIFGGVALLLFIYVPLIQFFLPSPAPVLADTNYSINIPKINAQAPVVDNVDPWNEVLYQKALEQGVAKASGFASPGEKGTIFMFAHSSDMPWRITRYNTVFLRLGELEAGDKITINKEGKMYTFNVVDKKEVWPQQVEFITDSDKDQLILQTCTPIGTALKRLLIFAEPIS